MIITFYDNNFIALQNNASLNVGKYNLTRKAVDFDDFSATSEAFVENVNPCFVVMKDDRGRYKYAGFAGIPELSDENQTNLQASDLKTLFNNEILAQFTSYTYLDEFLSALFIAFNTQVVQGSFAIDIDLTDVSDIAISDLAPSTNLKVYNVWDLIVNYLKYYDCYITSELDVANKTINYTIAKIDKYELSLQLWNYPSIKNYGKWIASLNEAQAVVSVSGSLTYGTKFILLSDSSITSAESLRDIYPIKKTTILKETTSSADLANLLNEGNQEAIEKIVENRYNESIEIGTSNIASYQDAGFDTSFNVYAERGTLYKKLPLGTIFENQDGLQTITLGYKNNDIINYI